MNVVRGTAGGMSCHYLMEPKVDVCRGSWRNNMGVKAGCESK